MAQIAVSETRTRQKLILHDALSFLSLIAITLVLLAVTLFLFRSFMSHRADLARNWADQGHAALLAHRPEQAIAAYRAALSYAPGEHTSEVMLAQALAEAGHIDEAYNYYMELWAVHPGDGFLNLQLAYLAARKGEMQDAINSYRASLYGTWEGDGVQRRREVRLELAQYLIAQRQFGPAHAELLVAGGNAPDTVVNDLTLARLLEQAGAPSDALNFYRKALVLDPKDLPALRNAGRLSFAAGDYETARRLLEEASRIQPESASDALLAESRRLLQLQPSDTLPVQPQVARILAMRDIARKRLASCSAEIPANSLSPTLQTLQARWTSPEATASRSALTRDPTKRTAAIGLAYDTELAGSHAPCSPPAGDDAVLLLLARSAANSEADHP